MSGANPGNRSLLARIGGRVRRAVLGDRVLVPKRIADPMWHLERGRSRIRGGEMVVRFDNLDADIALDARSDLAVRALGEGAYEPELLTALPAFVGRGDAINVGANVGVVAIVMRRAMATDARLLCVEPIEECVERLRRNLASAGCEAGVTICRAFATDKSSGTQQMWTVPGRPEYSSGGRLVHPSVTGAEHRSTVVPAIRLDDAVAAEGLAPTSIVMDCEGGEFNALRGARAILAASQPTIVMEFDPPLLRANGGDAASFLGFLAELGYACRTLTKAAEPVTEHFAGTAVAIPVSRIQWAESVIHGAFAAAVAAQSRG
jgi:FkbM family methyltransferase